MKLAPDYWKVNPPPNDIALQATALANQPLHHLVPTPYILEMFVLDLPLLVGLTRLFNVCLVSKQNKDNFVASVQQGHIIVTTLLQTWILLSATRSYLFTEFQDEHAKPMEEDTTLLHSIVLMYANLCTIAHTTLLDFF